MQQEKRKDNSDLDDAELGTATFRVVEDLQSVGVNMSEVKKLQDAGEYGECLRLLLDLYMLKYLY